MSKYVLIAAALGTARLLVWLEAEANYAKMPPWIRCRLLTGNTCR